MPRTCRPILLTTLITLGIGSTFLSATSGHGQSAADPAGAVDQAGNIQVPDMDYRKEWVALGTWAVAADEGVLGSNGMHVVYTQEETVTAYLETGKFPDGAVLVKELLGTETAEMTTGTISRAGDIEGWFVMVKDSTGKFENTNGLWGEGWGWAYFGADNSAETTTTDYESECLGCHVPAEGNDWIYTEGYPVLR
ncbi:cytochrome P460 family protein [uncultured Tateyamaria sp.]|uniref:cytochrome P460 family protein n=1 Tax=uncultured Tateyamaria sp. TaxID=455651 RepID=UPI00261044FE|nr:cytochrome P460 family protein [uncultured Tateyamaria sp.]